MKTIMFRHLIISLSFVFVLAACSSAASPTQEGAPTQDVVYTQAFQTVEAQMTVDAFETLAAQATITSQPPVGTITATLAPATPTATPTQTVTPTPKECTDKAGNVADVTVPDGTTYSPGDTFTKTWRVKNTGTCTWTKAYALVFVDGDQMSGQSPIPFTGDVAPGSQVDLSVELVAPASNGLYQGNWQLSNEEGKKFGIGENADKSFWVQINVGESSTDLADLGAPTWVDTFDSAAYWYLLETENTKFEVEDGQMVMTSYNPGGGEEWGLSSKGGIADFYMEATFKTGKECSGLDRYGLLVRAPDPNKGYVYGFSCDGRFRIYKWDGEHYQPIQEWKSSGDILAGPDKVNRLGIWLEGDTIRLYANRKLLGEYTDDTYSEGRFGLFIGSANTEDLVVYVDEIAYWLLKD